MIHPSRHCGKVNSRLRPPLIQRRLLAGFAALALTLAVLCPSFAGRAADGVCCVAKKVPVKKTTTAKKTADNHFISLSKGMARIVPVTGGVADIMVANPAIVDVTALQSNKLYVVGLNYGTTNVIALDTSGAVIANFDIHVQIDDVAIQNTVHHLFPKEDVHISATGDQIILTGHVSNPAVAEQVASLVDRYVSGARGSAGSSSTGGTPGASAAGASGSGPDSSIVNLLTVEGQQQVMLKVKVVEVSRNILRELGVELNSGSTTLTAGSGQFRSSFSTAAGSGLTADPLGVASIVHNSGGVIGPIQLLLRALDESGKVNTLAEPNLTAISGEQAGFLAGGEFPIPTARDLEGNVTLTYKPFGVALNFKPTVLSDDRINLQLQTEVSALSSANGYTLGATIIPGLSVRRAATTVEMGSGGSLMIAGLLQSDVTNDLRQLPGIKEVPILGQLFSSRNFQRNESELVVIVTAYLVKPNGEPQDAAPPVTPVPAAEPLATAFARNIHATYQKTTIDPTLMQGDSGYGYVLK